MAGLRRFHCNFGGLEIAISPTMMTLDLCRKIVRSVLAKVSPRGVFNITD